MEFNRSTRKGGGIETDGRLTVVNSTISGNVGKGGGGISAAGTALVSFSTIYQNESTNKIGAGTLRNGGSLTIWNSIVAQNIGSDGAFHDCSGTPSVSNVIFSSDQGCNPDGASVITAVPLEPLSLANGGRTPTHALPDETYPAVDARGFTEFDATSSCLALVSEDPLATDAVGFDQRGVERFPLLLDPVSPCDIGAYEFGTPLSLDIALDTSVDEIVVGAVRVPVENIQNAILGGEPEGTSTSSTPISAIPISAIPISAIPISAIPISAIDITDSPISAIPISAIPISAILLSEISMSDDLLAELVLADGTSLEALLEGSSLAGIPLLAMNLGDLLHVPLTGINFHPSVPLGSLALSSIPSDISTVVNCGDGAPGTVDCGDLTIVTLADADPPPANPPDPDTDPPDAFVDTAVLGDVLALDDISFGSTPISAIPISAIALGSTPISAIPISAIDGDTELTGLAAWCYLVGPELCETLGIEDPEKGGDASIMRLALAGVPISAIPISAIPISAIDLSASPISAIPISAIPISAIATQASPISAIPISAIASLLDCGAHADLCADPDATLGDAIQAAAFLDTATIQSLIDLGVLHDLTLGDLLLVLIPDASVPWEEIDLDEGRLPDAAEPKQPTFDYIVTLTVDGDFDAAVSLKLSPPPGFLFAKDRLPGSASIDGTLLELSPVEVLAEDAAADLLKGDLIVDLGILSRGVYSVRLAFRAGVVLGGVDDYIAFASATGVPSAGPDATAGPASAGIRVIEAGTDGTGGGDPAADVHALSNGVLYVGHIASADDVDLYGFEIGTDDDLIGSSAQILLSDVPDGADFDLVLYGPPLGDPLRGPNQEGFGLVEDFFFGLTPADQELDTDLLQDVQTNPAAVGLGAFDVELQVVSAKRGQNDEEIDTGTLQPGNYFVQVTSYNGSTSDDPYVLRIIVEDGDLASCDSPGFAFGPYVATASSSWVGNPLNTLFLYNHERLVDVYGALAAGDVVTELASITAPLSPWAVDRGVYAAVVPIDGDFDVYTAFDSLQADRCNPHASNDVVRQIGEVIDSYTSVHPIENIVIVGDDLQVPFARIPDGTELSNERTHGATFAIHNEVTGALAAGYYLSDDPYGSDAGIAVNNHEFFVPVRAVGRLVETPADIVQSLQNFITYKGMLDPSSGGISDARAVVSGYDFLEDGAELVAENLRTNGFDPTVELISEGWDSQALRDLLRDNPFIVGSINAHFDQNRALPALGNATGSEADLFTELDLEVLGDFSGTLLFSMGCHSGLSLNDVQIGVTDWAQSFAEEGALWLGNTGYGYGDTEIVALSESLSAAFAARVGTMTTGEAWVGAKQELASTLFALDPYNEKIMQEFVFYGLPMYRAFAEVGAAGGGGGELSSAVAAFLPPVDAQALAGLPYSVTPMPDVISGLYSVFESVSADLVEVTEGTPDGWTYYRSDGTLQVRARPVQPLTWIDVTSADPDLVAMGTLITGITGRQVTPFNPLYFTPIPDLGDTTSPGAEDAYRPAAGDATFPTAIQKIVSYMDDGVPKQRLLLVPGRYVENGPGGEASQELFTTLDTQIYYADADAPDEPAPYIAESRGFFGTGVVFFEVVVEPIDAQRVYVLFRPLGATTSTEWLGVDLAPAVGSDPRLWVGGTGCWRIRRRELRVLRPGRRPYGVDRNGQRQGRKLRYERAAGGRRREHQRREWHGRECAVVVDRRHGFCRDDCRRRRRRPLPA